MIAAVIIAAAITVLAVVKDDGSELRASTSKDAAPSAATKGGDPPAAPWRAAAVPRPAVPPSYVAAWDRARNRSTCALLFPTDGGPELAGAEATSGKTPEDNGWDIFLNGRSGTVEVLALFDKTTQTGKRATTPSFTKTWADGSVARYAPDAGNPTPGDDPASLPFEAVLILPDQQCAYRIYDTFGRAHLESLFDRLRLMAP